MKKDIKTKPTNTKPKMLEKASNIPKDATSIMREHLISQTENLKPEFKDKSQENATDYATGKIEEAADHARYEATRATGKAKDFTVQKIKEYRAEKAAQQQETPNEPQNPETNPESQSGEHRENTPKTKENYQPSQSENTSISSPQEQGKEFARQQQTDRIKTKDSVLNSEKAPTSTNEQNMSIKTKEEYFKAQGKEPIHEIDKSPKTLKSVPKGKADISVEGVDSVPISKIKAKDYIMQKQDAKKQADLVDQRNTVNADISPTGEHSANTYSIKTKEQYHFSENGDKTKDTIKTKKADIKTFDRKRIETARLKNRANASKQKASGKDAKEAVANAKINQKQTAKGTIKTRAGNISKTKSTKATKGIKTSKRMLKKSNPAKIAQKRAVVQARRKAAKKAAQETAKRTAQAAKATAHAMKVIAVKAAQLIAAATKAVVSALVVGGFACSFNYRNRCCGYCGKSFRYIYLGRSRRHKQYSHFRYYCGM